MANHCIAYSKARIRYGNNQEEALIFTGDASSADDEESRRSSHGYTVSLYGGLVSWRAPARHCDNFNNGSRAAGGKAVW
jgi:hypothetical protein